MLSLRAVRRLCAAADTAAIAAIAAGLSRPKSKSHLGSSTDNIAPPSSPDEAPHPAPADSILPASQPPPAGSESKQDPGSDLGLGSEPALARLKKERDPEKLFLIFQSNAHNRLVVENRFAFEDTVARLAGARRGDLIERLLEQQKALPQGRREGFVMRIITLYGKAGMPGHALRTFDEMPLYGCPRTVKSFNATLRVLCKSRCLDWIQSFVEHAPAKYGILLDEISYNIFIKVLCEAGSLESAYLVMVEMEQVKIKPDVVTYTTLMAAFYKHGRRVIGDGLWNLMVLRGCPPNLAAFNVRIQHLINRNKAWQAKNLMKKMAASGIRPDELTFNLLMKGFCRMGELEMAKRVFLAMRDSGCQPNSKIYQTMVHYLCKAREFELAFRLCRDGMERNWFPSIPSIQNLLRGLMSVSKGQSAEEIMSLVRARVPPYSAGEMEALQSAVSPDRRR